MLALPLLVSQAYAQETGDGPSIKVSGFGTGALNQQVSGAILWTVAELLDLPFLALTVRQWLRPRVRLAWAQRQLAETVANFPQTADSPVQANRQRWIDFVDLLNMLFLAKEIVTKNDEWALHALVICGHLIPKCWGQLTRAKNQHSALMQFERGAHGHCSLAATSFTCED